MLKKKSDFVQIKVPFDSRNIQLVNKKDHTYAFKLVLGREVEDNIVKTDYMFLSPKCLVKGQFEKLQHDGVIIYDDINDRHVLVYSLDIDDILFYVAKEWKFTIYHEKYDKNTKEATSTGEEIDIKALMKLVQIEE